MQTKSKVLGFPALKGDFIKDEIRILYKMKMGVDYRLSFWRL
jgi:hypothetical protein